MRVVIVNEPMCSDAVSRGEDLDKELLDSSNGAFCCIFARFDCKFSGL